jgi:hypothetical protein
MIIIDSSKLYSISSISKLMIKILGLNFISSIIFNDGIQYYLKAINRYTKYHSTA